MSTNGQAMMLCIESRSDGQTVTQNIQADMYVKGNAYFIRYLETEGGIGRISATVRIQQDEIRILRRGDMESEMMFVAGMNKHGWYALPQGRIELETRTSEIIVQWSDAGGHASWSYELMVDGQSSGFFELKLTARTLH
jgi:uncharacterized beta-barrel protein YwiB (DUF1934 family)